MVQVSVNTQPLPKHMTASRLFQGIPGIEVTPKGRLWATWYSGGLTEGPNNFAVLVTSTDGGNTWSDAVAVVDPPGHNRAFDPTLWIGPDGVLRWFWAQTWSPRDGIVTNGIDGVWMSECSDLESGLPEWSEPVRIANGIMMNKPVVLSDGTWAFPTAIWKGNLGGVAAPSHLGRECYSNITVSTDGGKTFYLRGGADIPNRCFDEHHIVELKDKRLWILTRANYGIGESFSTDMGWNWSPGQDSGISGPNSRFYIRRLKSGRLILINHKHETPSNWQQQTWRCRNNLTAFISDDDGKTWSDGLLLDERDGVSYPDGCQDADGNIIIIYDYERTKEGDILMAKFTEEDVLAGKLVSPESKLKMLINHSGGIDKHNTENK